MARWFRSLSVLIALPIAMVPSAPEAATSATGADPIFSDSFENAATFMDLFPPDGSRWTNFGRTMDGNVLDLTRSTVHSGSQALICFALPYDGVTASKAYISRSFFSFSEGSEVWTEIWVFFADGPRPVDVFFWDLEAPATCTSADTCPEEGSGDVCGSPGRRLYIPKPGLAVASDLGKWCVGEEFRQEPGSERVVPLGRWVRFRVYLRLSPETDGEMRVWQDEDLIIDALGITLPRADSIYERLQVGITANGDRFSAHTLFLDDVSVWDAAPAWYLLTLPPAPVDDLLLTRSLDDLELAWTRPDAGGRHGEVESYRIYRSESVSGGFSLEDEIYDGSNELRWIDPAAATPVPPFYAYEVIAANGNGESDPLP